MHAFVSAALWILMVSMAAIIYFHSMRAIVNAIRLVRHTSSVEKPVDP